MKIYTLGYSGSSHEDLRRYVKATNAMMVDIRFAPYSKAEMWQGRNICQAVGGANYVHIQAFGNRNYKGGGPIVLANPGAGLVQVRNILQRRSVILLCMCHDWQECHRTIAANYVASATRLEVEHLPARFDKWQQTVSAPPVFGEADPREYEVKSMRNNCLTGVVTPEEAK